MNKSLTVLCLLLAAAAIFFGWSYFDSANQLRMVRTELTEQNLNVETIGFLLFFIDKVLRASGEVDFETRLNLENRIRDLQNPEILTSWQRFTASRTEDEAQENVKNLLELLVKNIKS